MTVTVEVAMGAVLGLLVMWLIYRKAVAVIARRRRDREHEEIVYRAANRRLAEMRTAENDKTDVWKTNAADSGLWHKEQKTLTRIH